MDKLTKQIKFAIEIRQEQIESQNKNQSDPNEDQDYKEKYNKLREQYIEALDVIEEYENEISKQLQDLKVRPTLSGRFSERLAQFNEIRINDQQIFETEKSDLENDLYVAKQENIKLQKQLVLQEQDIQNLTEKLNQVSGFKKQYDEIYQKYEGHKKKYDQLKDDKIEIETMNENLHRENCQIKKQNDSNVNIKKEFKEMKQENENLKKKLEILTNPQNTRQEIRLLNQVIVSEDNQDFESLQAEDSRISNRFTQGPFE